LPVSSRVKITKNYCDSNPIHDISDRRAVAPAPAPPVRGGEITPRVPASAASVDFLTVARFAGDAEFTAAASTPPRSISFTARCTTGDRFARMRSTEWSGFSPPVSSLPPPVLPRPPLSSSSSTSAARPLGPFAFFRPVVAASDLAAPVAADSNPFRLFLFAPEKRGSAESQPRTTGLHAGGAGAGAGVRASTSPENFSDFPTLRASLLSSPVAAADLLASTRSLASSVRSCSARSASCAPNMLARRRRGEPTPAPPCSVAAATAAASAPDAAPPSVSLAESGFVASAVDSGFVAATSSNWAAASAARTPSSSHPGCASASL